MALTRYHRRDFIGLATWWFGASVASTAVAQQKPSIPRIGVLQFDRVPAYEDALRQALRAHGYVDGQNIVIEYRYLSGRTGTAQERQDAAALELLSLKPDVLVAGSAFAVAFKRVAAQVPVVFVAVSDPVGWGLAATLARPGGNFTGLSYQGVDLNVKRLELLREALPNVKRVGVLGTRTHPLFERARQEVEKAAAILRSPLEIVTVADGHPEEIDSAIAALAQRGVGAMLALQGGVLYLERRRLVELAVRHRLPAMFELTEFVELGGMMSYSASMADLYRRAAEYIHKILKGAKPADLPVEQPTKFELVINLKTAKALGVTIPPSVLLRADQIVE